MIEVQREWAPLAADRFHELICAKFYSDARFYRVVPGFVVQFGMNADPVAHEAWQAKKLPAEPTRMSNKRGTIGLTRSAAPDSRTTHAYINLADNAFVDEQTPPFGIVVSGMEVVDSLYSGYGETPEQDRLWREGNRYLLERFPDLDYIIDVQIEDAISQYIGELLREHAPGINGIKERYAGTSSPLRAGLEHKAESHFPRHRFVLADLFYSHWVPDDGTVRMLLVMDRASGDVSAHAWSPWYAGHSESFADFLRGYTPESEGEAIELVTTLAQTLAATSEQFTVGRVAREGSEIVAPLLSGDEIWRSMRVAYTREEGFGRMRMINPVSGESDAVVQWPIR